MFKFLKDKLKSAVAKISEKIEKEGKAEEIEVPKEPEPTQHAPMPEERPDAFSGGHREQSSLSKEEKHEKKGFFSAVTSLFRKKEEVEGAAKKEEPAPEKPLDKGERQEGPEKEQEEHGPETLPAIVPEAGMPAVVEEKTSSLQEAEKPEPIEVPAAPIQKRGEAINEEKTTEEGRPFPKQTTKKGILAKKEASKDALSHKKDLPSAEPLRQELKTQSKKVLEGAVHPLKGEPEEKRGFFSALKQKILTTTISAQQFEEMFFELEIALLENNVAVEVIEKVKHDLKQALVGHPMRRSRVEEVIILSLKGSIKGLFEHPFDVVSRIREKSEKPFVIAFVGINGSGKTTSIAKMASYLQDKDLSVVLAAADTFRAASIEQLSVHGEKLGVKVVKHDYGADPAAVAFDAIKHAQAKGIDVVLIDTAGRMHSNADLVNEMKKIIRVAKPDLKIFVGESITGNDCVEQAKTFNEAISIDGIILAKADVDEKGGAAVSVSYVTKKPILYIGTGQDYKDLQPFDVGAVMENLGLV